jgi:1-deoxy-D-xylulose-5-phosphate synthase
MATGLALGGMRPVVAIYSTFSQRAFDQIVHDVCQNDVPVLIAIDRAGLVGEDGTSHQGMFTLPAQRSLPNLVIGSPKDEQELRDLVATALVHDGPISLHYPRDAGEDLPDREGRVLDIGVGEVLEEGADLLLVGFGPIVQRLRAAAAVLRNAGLTATVINARWAKPLDGELLARHAAGKRLVVTAEESAAMGGFGDGVLDALNQAAVRAPVLKIALAEGFVDHGAVDDLRRQQRIDVPGIVGRIAEALGIEVPAEARETPTTTAA